MKLREETRMVPFAKLADGSLFLLQARDEPRFAIKAFTSLDDGKKKGWIVTIWPSEASREDGFMLFDSRDLEQAAVLDLTSVYEFTVSVLPEDIADHMPVSRDCVGRCIFAEQGTFLGIRDVDNPPAWKAAFLNLRTGELTWSLRDSAKVAAKKWELKLCKKMA